MTRVTNEQLVYVGRDEEGRAVLEPIDWRCSLVPSRHPACICDGCKKRRAVEDREKQ